MFNALRPLLLISAIAFVLPAQAQEEAGDTPSERESAGDRVRQVEREGGRVLQAEPMQRSGREVYRLKVLTPEGRVRVLDDSSRRESGPETFERRRFGREASDRAIPALGERGDREPEARREPPPERMETPRQESVRGDDGRDRSPNH